MATDIKPPGREEVARIEIGHTAISRGQSWLLIIAFLGTVLLVPVVQGLHGPGPAEGPASGGRPWRGVAGRLAAVGRTFRDADAGLFRRTLSANGVLLGEIGEFEDQLEEASLLTRALPGPMQQLQIRWAGVGNEQAYLGREGWLFYRPGVDYLTGRGFLDPTVLSRRAEGGNEHTAAVQPDPRKAILQFGGQLAERGIKLVIVPTPAKPMIHPEMLSGRYEEFDRVLQNPSYARFKEELESAGILVFDMAPRLVRRKTATGDPQFLRADTHWLPGAMEETARGLAGFLREHVDLPRAEVAYASRDVEVTNLGDVAAMLQLPEDQALFPAQTVKTRRVTRPDGGRWEPAADGEVLLLGDSFTNIYSRAGMNWGESAGFAEHLSCALGRRIDRISQNDAGAYATRQTVSREMTRGRDRLGGKRVVVWQFAIRELAVGDWKLLPMTVGEGRPPRGRSPDGPPLAARQLLVSGTVKAVSGMPKPGTVPYRNGITSIHLVDMRPLAGEAPAREAVLYTWGMRDNKWTAAVRHRPGAPIRMRLTPWADVERKFGTFNRVELDDPDFELIDLPVYWAEEMK